MRDDFDRMDLNRDGVVDRAEYTAFQAQHGHNQTQLPQQAPNAMNFTSMDDVSALMTQQQQQQQLSHQCRPIVDPYAQFRRQRPKSPPRVSSDERPLGGVGTKSLRIRNAAHRSDAEFLGIGASQPPLSSFGPLPGMVRPFTLFYAQFDVASFLDTSPGANACGGS